MIFKILTIILSLILFTPSMSLCLDEILIGISPEENIFYQMERYRHLADYLSSKIGIKVKLTILSKHGDIIDNFTVKKMDGAFFEVFTAILAMDKLGVEPLVRNVNLENSSMSKSLIFVRKDSGIRTVKDMAGKRMAFVDRATIKGYLFAINFLKENGISNIDKFFKEYYFTGSYDSAIYSVLDRRADIGISKSNIYNKFIEKIPGAKDELTIIAESRDFPDTIFCLRKDFPVDVKKRIKDVLLNMHNDLEGKKVLERYKAKNFIEVTKDDFAPSLELLTKAGVNLKTYKYK